MDVYAFERNKAYNYFLNNLKVGAECKTPLVP